MDNSKTNIYIIVGDPSFNSENKNSAVAQYLNSIMGVLNKAYQIQYIFSNSREDLLTIHLSKESRPKLFSLKSFLRDNMKFIYYTIFYFMYFKKQNRIENEAFNVLTDKDIVIEFLTVGSQIGAKLKAKRKCKLIVIYDSPLAEQSEEMYKTKTIFINRIAKREKKSLLAADTIICYSPIVKKYLYDKYKLTKTIQDIPCILWKNPVIHSENCGNYIGFIGSFLKWHKVVDLVDAFEIVARKHMDVYLVLIGYGEEWDNIKLKVNRSPYQDRIYMTGFVNEEELKDWKSKISIGVMPGSNWYGSPLKLFEYAESGIPIIAPDTPSVRCFFTENETALFIDKHKEIESLTNHLEYLLKNEEIRLKMGNAAKTMMETRFAKEKVMAKFVSIVKQLSEDEPKI